MNAGSARRAIVRPPHRHRAARALLPRLRSHLTLPPARPTEVPDSGEAPPTRGGRHDGGFTLAEVTVSIMLISIVLAAVTSYFVSALGTVRLQSGRQSAIQLATDGLDRARTIESSSLVTGRDQQSVDAQWAAPVAGVDLSGTQEVFDTTAAGGAGASAALPTTATSVTVDGVTYRRYWYLGKCWQPAGTGNCTRTSSYAEMYRVIVAVTWSERGCPGNLCVYLASTLISDKYPDPVFNVNGG